MCFNEVIINNPCVFIVTFRRYILVGSISTFGLSRIREKGEKEDEGGGNGGASSEDELIQAIDKYGAAAAAAGSLFSLQGIHDAVLITYKSLNNYE